MSLGLVWGLAAIWRSVCIRQVNIIIRLHRRHIDAAYCYRLSNVVCRSVYRSVTLVNPAKTAEPIEMPFLLRTRVGPGDHVFGGGPHPQPWEGAILMAILTARPCSHLCKNGWTDRDAVWVAESGGPKEPRIRWGTDPSREGAILRGRACLNIPDDTLMWTVRKRLNRSRCRLVYGLGLAQRSMH